MSMVWPVATYECENWIIKERNEAFETKCIRQPKSASDSDENK